MIYGIGTDIVYIPRMAKAFARFGNAFAKRILTVDEYIQFSHSHKPAAFLATRFAVKEAAAKAFGVGFRQGLSLRHIGVVHNALRKPQLVFFDAAAIFIQTKGITHTHVSITDDHDYAMAYVILEQSVK